MCHECFIEARLFKKDHALRLEAFASQMAMAMKNTRLHAEGERLAYQMPITAILLDIDHFKKINDTFGITVGDRVLVSLAGAINRNFREIDLFENCGIRTRPAFSARADWHG